MGRAAGDARPIGGTPFRNSPATEEVLMSSRLHTRIALGFAALTVSLAPLPVQAQCSGAKQGGASQQTRSLAKMQQLQRTLLTQQSTGLSTAPSRVLSG